MIVAMRVAASVLLVATAVRAAPLEPCRKGDYDDPTWVCAAV